MAGKFTPAGWQVVHGNGTCPEHRQPVGLDRYAAEDNSILLRIELGIEIIARGGRGQGCGDG